MKNLHLNNSSKSQQSIDKFAMNVFLEITNNKEGEFQISIDDGDGDVWKYTVSIHYERVNTVTQITEN